MFLESPQNWKDYSLIDSGNFEKLERFGSYVLIRPEPKALWKPSLPEKEWLNMAHTKFTAGAGFGKSGKEDTGTWKMLKKMPEQWYIIYNLPDTSFKLRLGLTSFKHVGVFPEQSPNWNFIYKNSKELVEKFSSVKKEDGTPLKPKVLNLFAYTGAASLAARCAGADTTHLDSVRQVVTWARGNMENSGLDNIRWVVEDALKFVKREAKRGNKYNGLILDPPAYGHGPDGEKWKLDELLFELLTECSKIVAPKDAFMVLNLYSNGYSAMLADTAVRTAFDLLPGKDSDVSLTCGELMLKDSFNKNIPLSVFSRLRR
jgi:23S rRNA (cytosine1962-C5)-methyltransferase